MDLMGLDLKHQSFTIERLLITMKITDIARTAGVSKIPITNYDTDILKLNFS